MGVPKQFSIVLTNAVTMPPAFKGSADAVIEWLKAQSDVSGYKVHSQAERRYFTVDQFLRQHIIPEFYSQLVPKYYRMDPKTEDMLPNGEHLANGMMVLIASPDSREYPENLSKADGNNDWLKDKLLERNRWCKVSHVATKGDTVSFIGVYEDGTKHQYLMGVGHAWLVKTDSIADSQAESTERYKEVLRLIEGAMATAIRTVRSKESSDARSLKVGAKAEETTQKILGTLG